jgi:CRISPR-associated protein Cas5d
MPQKSETFHVNVRGPFACFTRPEFKVERVSYEVMTPSAARGILEAVHWKPAIRWVVTEIHVLNPIRFISFKRNEVKSKVKVTNVLAAMKGIPLDPFFVGGGSEECAPRNTVALRDVDYVIAAHFVPVEGKWHETDNFAKHAETFARRLEKGQTFHQPYLGCREFAAAVEPARSPWECQLPLEQRGKKLGLMLHDLEFGERIRPRFFMAELTVEGVLKVPPFEEAMRGRVIELEGEA